MLLNLLFKAKPVQRRLLLQLASDELILTAKVALDILCGTIPLTNAQYKKLEKSVIKFIADKKIGMRKRRAINQIVE